MAFDTSQSAYVALRSVIAEHTESVVLWIGSGLSTEAELPTWAGFRTELTRELSSKAETFGGEERGKLKQVLKHIEKERNNWIAFGQLRTHLGMATWREVVREVLRPAATSNTPSGLLQLWKLGIRGILNLNLDRLATKAYSEALPGSPLLAEFTGKEAGEYIHVLKSPAPFVCNLHGELDNASSWVLTVSELAGLRNDPKYTTFVETCLTAKTVVFLGVSTDDIAVGGFLDHIAELRIDCGAHYWITSRKDLETDQWAEARGVRVIRYEADVKHSDLTEMLNDLKSYVSRDDPTKIPPVVADMSLGEPQPPSPRLEWLLNQDAETIRKALNRQAASILTSRDPDAYMRYDQFSRDYDQAIYRAWYTSTTPGQNQMLGYTLLSEKATGAFGRVYKATDSEGQEVAIKILHEQIRRNPDMLHSFRRGVHSMRILKDHNVQGMVPYREAFEIPAFVAMDWIDGPNLNEAVAAKRIDDWSMILKVGTAIADIVRRGHLLPERVLHRDLRPSNVMLKGFYATPDDWEVVVLDFDLSWHRGAFEKSVVQGSTLFGYLAPEQIQPSIGVSTRHAAVDSFGLGMVLFFMISGRNPLPDEHRHVNWSNTVTSAAAKWPCRNWCSTGRRFARLIEYATRDRQAERWDMAQIQGEMSRMLDAVLHLQSVRSPELVAEELAERCDFTRNYTWNGSTFSAEKESPSSVRLQLRGDESARRIRLEVAWGQPGVHGKKYTGKFIEPAATRAEAILKSSGWHLEEASHKYASILISASLPVEDALRDIHRTVGSINKVAAQLMFE